MKRLFTIGYILALFLMLIIPVAKLQPYLGDEGGNGGEVSEGWANRFVYDVDYGNGTHASTSHIGPQVFWDSSTGSWQELLLVNHTDAVNPHYLIRNAYVTARVGISSELETEGVLYYNPDFTRFVAAEHWTPQAYLWNTTEYVWTTLDKTLYSHEVFYDETLINITGIFKVTLNLIQVGWLRLSYILRPGAYLKHEVVCRSISSTTAEFRCVVTLFGLAGTRIEHYLGNTTVILTEQQIEGNWFRVVNSSNPTFQFFEERLQSLGHYDENGTWINDYLKAIRVKLADYKGISLTRVDIVIGNWALEQYDELFIDPDSSTWEVSASSDDGYMSLAWDSTSINLASGKSAVGTSYHCFLRFLGINIAQASTISEAIVGGYCGADPGTGTPNLLIKCIDEDNTTTYSADPTGRALTDANAEWNPSLGSNQWINTTDFASAVEEVIARGGWESGNAIGVRISPDADCSNVEWISFEAFDNAGTNEPELYITWSAGGDSTDPLYDNNTLGKNDTKARRVILFYVNCSDDSGLSYFTLQHNSSGSYANETFTSFGADTWANYTKNFDLNPPNIISWNLIFNDTSNNWNASMPLQNFTLTFYAELTVTTNTHSWSGFVPGDSDVLINEGTISLTVTANANFNVQAKGSGNLAFGSNTIDLSNVKVHEDTLGSAISLTTDYQDVPGLTNEAYGDDLSKTFKLWLSCPVGKPVGGYTYTLSVQVIQA